MQTKHYPPSPDSCIQGASGNTRQVPTQDSRKALVINALVVLVLALLVVCIFSKTIFLGQPISRVCRLAERDSLFSIFCTGNREPYDCSIYQSLVPYFYLVTNTWRSGQLPLWNPYSGLGSPLAGDILTTAFAPLRLLAAFSPNLHTYNCILVLQAALSMIGMYLLGRRLGLNQYAASFAATAYSLCPYFLFSLELTGTSTCLFPLLFWLFARMAGRPNATNSIIAGIGSAVVLLSGHPELSFFGIVFASLLAVLLIVTQNPGRKLWLSLRDASRCLFLAGLVAFCLSAPVLLPFAEYMANADCYKSSLTTYRYVVPWQAVLYNFCQPGFGGGSPYLGIVAAILSIASIVFHLGRHRLVTGLTLLAILALSVTCKLGPMDMLFAVKPLSWFMTEYCLPIFLIWAAILSAFGLQQLSSEGNYRLHLIVMVSAALVLFSVPTALSVLRVDLAWINLNDYLAHMSTNVRCLYRDAIIAATFLSLVLLLKRPGWAAVISCLFIGLNLASIAPSTQKAAPPQPRFEYNAVEPLTFLREHPARMLSMGRHTFCPSTNLIYGICNLVSPNVQYPSRVVQFLQSTGASIEGVNQYFDGKLSSLIDLASVRYVVSQAPVIFSRDSYKGWLRQGVEPTSGSISNDGFQLTPVQLLYDGQNSQAVAVVEWKVDAKLSASCQYSPLITDEQGNALWLGDSQPLVRKSQLANTTHATLRTVTEIPFLVPIALKDHQALIAGIQVVDYKSNQLHHHLKDQGALSSIYPIARFKALRIIGTAAGRTPHFKLLSETPVNHIRVYENQMALPPAYLVNKVIPVNGEKEALTQVCAAGFDPRVSVVLEDVKTNHIVSVKASIMPQANSSATWRRPDQNQVVIDTAASQPSWLVLTDVFYPGWNATVDQQPTAIHRANYLFRSVAVPAGRHQIVFRYQPLSFMIGTALALGCLLCISMYLFLLTINDKIYRRNPATGGLLKLF